MTTQQAVLSKRRADLKGRHVAPTVDESMAAGVAAAEAAAMPAGWKPSRFFEAWKKVAAEKSAFKLCWLNMGHYSALTPKDRKRVIGKILRITIASRAYDSDDFYEGVLASHNDYGAMQVYVSAFVDAFWKDYWTDCIE